jgi:glycosyltransferase involved in cell wall biosynthesis
MMSRLPKLSVVIPWKDRPELEETLNHNGLILYEHNAEIIVANCAGNVSMLRRITSSIKEINIRHVYIPAKEFNKSLAINLGVYNTRADRLFLLDADILIEDEFLSLVLEAMDSPCIVTVARVFESRTREEYNASSLAMPPELAEIQETGIRAFTHVFEMENCKGKPVRLETNRVHIQDGSRSGPGLVLLTKAHFIAVEGMNSQLSGWGWEDLDLLARLQLALGLSRQEYGSVVHLSHDDSVREVQRGDRKIGQQNNFYTSLSNYVIGNFLGTYTNDVSSWKGRLEIEEM